MGGLAKKGDRFLLPKRYYKNINCYIYGTNKSFFINVFKKKLKFQLFDKLSQIVKKIKIDSIYKENINIIFSPAAASFDQFSNFEHRGRYFNSLIKKYKF